VETLEVLGDVPYLGRDAEASERLLDELFKEEVDATESDLLDTDLDMCICLDDAKTDAVARRTNVVTEVVPLKRTAST